MVVVVVVGEDAQAPLRTTEGDGGGWCWAADGESLVGGEKLETGGPSSVRLFVRLRLFRLLVETNGCSCTVEEEMRAGWSRDRISLSQQSLRQNN